MHQNFYKFEAKNNFELGLKIGHKFKNKAHQKLAFRKKGIRWPEEKRLAEGSLEISTNHFPEYVEELKGYAQGAEIEFLDLWTLSLEEENEFFPKNERCTSFFTNHNFLVGHAEDAFKGAENDICLVLKKLPHIQIFEIYYFHTLGGNAVSINSNGFVTLVNTLHHKEKKLGLPRNLISRFISETEDPIKTYEKLSKMSLGAAYNYNIMSKKGEGWNIEHTSTKEKLSKIESPFVHTNHYLTDLKEYELKRPGANSFSRFNWTKENLKEQMNEDEVKKILKDESQGPEHSIFNERTIGQIVLDVKKWQASIWLLSEDAKEWQDYQLPEK